MKDKFQDITLKSGIEVTVDWNRKDKCKSCGKDIIWSVTKNEKFMPIELVSLMVWDSHYATCPQADKWRKK